MESLEKRKTSKNTPENIDTIYKKSPKNIKLLPQKIPLIVWIFPLFFLVIALISLYLNFFVVRYEAVDTVLFHTYNIVYQSNGKEVGTLIELLAFPVPWGGIFIYLMLGVLFGIPVLAYYKNAKAPEK